MVFQFPYRTVAEISIRALLRNLAYLRSYSRKEIIPVVKADAYGHGMVPIAKALISRGSVQMLAVATLEEAIELRKRTTPSVSILVLSGFLPHQFEAYRKYRLTPVIHCLAHLKSLLGHRTFPDLHLKLDTGMSRLGIQQDELPEAMRVIEKLHVKLSGLMTHFADAEVKTSSFMDQQIEDFLAAEQALRENRLLNTDARIHLSNSGGLLRSKAAFATSVRPGLSLYGIPPSPSWEEPSLIPVLQWKTRVLAIKTIKKGQTVGYHRTYRAKKTERIAILPIGYADGFPRELSKHGQVLIEGKRVPVRGRVSMDLTAVDCTSLSGIKEGSVAVLFGSDGKNKLGAWEVAQWAGTAPYEIFCRISPRVPRVYLD